MSVSWLTVDWMAEVRVPVRIGIFLSTTTSRLSLVFHSAFCPMDVGESFHWDEAVRLWNFVHFCGAEFKLVCCLMKHLHVPCNGEWLHYPTVSLYIWWWAVRWFLKDWTYKNTNWFSIMFSRLLSTAFVKFMLINFYGLANSKYVQMFMTVQA